MPMYRNCFVCLENCMSKLLKLLVNSAFTFLKISKQVLQSTPNTNLQKLICECRHPLLLIEAAQRFLIALLFNPDLQMVFSLAM